MSPTKTKAPRPTTARALTPRGKQNTYPKDTPIFVNSQAVGHVRDGIFYKKVRASAHFLRKPRAIAFDISTLHDAQEAGASQVEVTDTETGRVYVARIDDILRDGKRFNRGYGWQIYYLLSRWRTPDAPEQLTIFDIPAMGDARARLAAGPGVSRGETLTRKRKGALP